MKQKEFFSLISDEFNLADGSIEKNTLLEEIQGWDSMSILAIMALVDDRFGITLSADDFSDVKTVGDIMTKIGANHFDS